MSIAKREEITKSIFNRVEAYEAMLVHEEGTKFYQVVMLIPIRYHASGTRTKADISKDALIHTH